MPSEPYDAIVIGTGQGGYPLALAWAEAGRKTAVIERGAVGGSCVNYGCTQTKTMVASARVAHLARRAEDYGLHVGDIRVNMRKIRQRKRDIVGNFSDGSRKRLENTKNLDLIFGEARFIGEKTVEVALNDGGTRTLTADEIFINTGLRPAVPDVEGLDQVSTLDNASIMELDEVPPHLIVMGGGYVGLEFAQMFRRFGGEVTIFDRNQRLLKREDEDVSREVAKILREDGIEVLLETEAVRASQSPDGRIELTMRTPDGVRPLAGSHVLVAAGRIPNTDMLDLDRAGIETDERGFIKVNEKSDPRLRYTGHRRRGGHGGLAGGHDGPGPIHGDPGWGLRSPHPGRVAQQPVDDARLTESALSD